MTSFKLVADDGLGVASLVGSGFQDGLPHMPVTVYGVVWYGVRVQPAVPNKFNYFRPNYLIWAVLQR